MGAIKTAPIVAVYGARPRPYIPLSAERRKPPLVVVLFVRRNVVNRHCVG